MMHTFLCAMNPRLRYCVTLFCLTAAIYCWFHRIYQRFDHGISATEQKLQQLQSASPKAPSAIATAIDTTAAIQQSASVAMTLPMFAQDLTKKSITLISCRTSPQQQSLPEYGKQCTFELIAHATIKDMLSFFQDQPNIFSLESMKFSHVRDSLFQCTCTITCLNQI